jgi:hypothetical protein
VSELIQPLAASDRAEVAASTGGHVPSFTELVYAHYAWWRELRGNGDAPHSDAAAAYQDVLRRFEEHHGRVIHSFWCSEIESAVALTERPRRGWWEHRRLAFHRESDWATKEHPDIAAELHRCDDLAVRAQAVLTGVRQRICLQRTTASAAHLLSLVDGATQLGDDAATAKALASEREVLDKTEAYYCHAANGQAQIAYFVGMVAVAALISLIAALVLSLEWASGVASLVAGAIGAVVSVIQRINAGHFELEYDVGRPYAFFLGGLRPLIGGAFALAISFAFTSGITHLPIADKSSTEHQHLALVVVSFLAGFSERWAQDTLATALPSIAGGVRGRKSEDGRKTDAGPPPA